MPAAVMVRIVGHTIRYEERARTKGRSFSWSRKEVHDLIGECGHVREHRGFTGVPKHQFACKECERGAPRRTVAEALLGTRDLRDAPIENPIAAALVPGGC